MDTRRDTGQTFVLGSTPAMFRSSQIEYAQMATKEPLNAQGSRQSKGTVLPVLFLLASFPFGAFLFDLRHLFFFYS